MQQPRLQIVSWWEQQALELNLSYLDLFPLMELMLAVYFTKQQ